VRKFRKDYNCEHEINSQRLITDASKIFHEFVADDAKTQLNLPAAATDKVKKLFLDTVCHPRAERLCSRSSLASRKGSINGSLTKFIRLLLI